MVFPQMYTTGGTEGSRSSVLLILNLGTRWARVVKARPQLLYARDRAAVYIVEETRWPQSARGGY